MTTSVTGYLAGEGVARFLEEQPRLEITLDEEAIAALQQEIYAPLNREGLSPKSSVDRNSENHVPPTMYLS